MLSEVHFHRSLHIYKITRVVAFPQIKSNPNFVICQKLLPENNFCDETIFLFQIVKKNIKIILLFFINSIYLHHEEMNLIGHHPQDE